MSYLLSRSDCDVNAADNAGNTPAFLAAYNGRTLIFLYLAFKGKADLKKRDKSGATVLHTAAYSNSVNILKLMKHLPDVFDINARDIQG